MWEQYMRYEIRYRCPDGCLDHCSKSFVAKHIEEHHELRLKTQKIFKCFQPFCKFETDKRIDIRAHLQKEHDMKDSSQSRHLLQRLKHV